MTEQTSLAAPRRGQTPPDKAERLAQRQAVLHRIRDHLTVVLGFNRVMARRAGFLPASSWFHDRLDRMYAAAERMVAELAELEDLYELEDRQDAAGPAEVVAPSVVVIRVPADSPLQD